MKIRRMIVAGALALIAIGGTSLVASANDIDPDTNQVAYWCEGGHGIKYEPVSTPFVVPAPPDGFTWTLLVLKAGSDESANPVNETFANPVVGQSYSRTDGKSISHAILCKTYTPTTTQGSTTTAASTTIATTTTGATTTAASTTLPSTTQPSTTIATTTTAQQTTTTGATTTQPTTTQQTFITTTLPQTTTTAATTTAPAVTTTTPSTTAAAPTTAAPTPQPAAPSTTLPVTGSTTAPIAAFGFASLLSGVALLGVSRRRSLFER